MKEMRLIDTSRVPGNGWKAKQPETGHVVSGGHLPALVRNVLVYRNANRLPCQANAQRMVESQVCATMFADEALDKCIELVEDDQQNPPELRQRRSSMEDLKNFALAVEGLIESKATGTNVHVVKDEAERRAAICSNCPKNLPVGNCWGCGVLGSLYRKLLGYLTTSKDPLLQSCDVCGCDNKVSVHLAEDVHVLVAQKQGLEADEFPSPCWKKNILRGGLV